MGHALSYFTGLLAATLLVAFTAQGKVPGAVVTIAGFPVVAWITTLLPLPVWVWRMARLVAAASASTAALLVSAVLGVTFSRSEFTSSDSVLLAFLAVTVFLAAVGMWTGELRIAQVEALEAEARHAELLEAVAAARTKRPVPSLLRATVFLTAASLVVLRRRSR